jgi:hypothetical protein
VKFNKKLAGGGVISGETTNRIRQDDVERNREGCRN